MHITTDRKFLTTFFLAVVVIAAVLLVINWLAGPNVTTIVGASLAPVAVGIFQKFDTLSAHEHQINLTWDMRGWLWALVVGPVVIYGSKIFSALWLTPWQIIHGPYAGCRMSALIPAGLIGYAGIYAGGYLVGRLVPERALTAALVGVVVTTVARFVGAADQLATILTMCRSSLPLGTEGVFGVGAAFGLVVGPLASVTFAALGANRGAKTGFVRVERGVSVTGQLSVREAMR